MILIAAFRAIWKGPMGFDARYNMELFTLVSNTYRKSSRVSAEPVRFVSCSGLIISMLKAVFDDDHILAHRFRAFVQAPSFPCVGAKAALSRRQMNFVVCRSISSAWDDLRVLPALLEIIRRYREERALFRTFVVLFEDDMPMSEGEFEAHMWDRLQSMSDKDDWLGFDPDRTIDSDPESPHFSLSFGGEAFFVVGFHPNASRPARRCERPALVFNLHDQFVTLRAQGKYEKLRASILERDMAIAGSLNPMLARHGEVSEARQYSGRVLADEWVCPFRRRAAPAR